MKIKHASLLLALALLLLAGCTTIATPTATPAATAAPAAEEAPIQGPAPPPTAAAATPEALSPAEVQGRLAREDVILLDVREPFEWADPGYIEGAVRIPLGELPARVGELDPDKEIIVMCNSGNRSKTGLQILQDAGFARLSELEGGIQNWMTARLPVEICANIDSPDC